MDEWELLWGHAKLFSQRTNLGSRQLVLLLSPPDEAVGSSPQRRPAAVVPFVNCTHLFLVAPSPQTRREFPLGCKQALGCIMGVPCDFLTASLSQYHPDESAGIDLRSRVSSAPPRNNPDAPLSEDATIAYLLRAMNLSSKPSVCPCLWLYLCQICYPE